MYSNIGQEDRVESGGVERTKTEPRRSSLFLMADYREGGAAANINHTLNINRRGFTQRERGIFG